MKLGFSGTQQGMTGPQYAVVGQWIKNRSDRITEGHHGDCIGADQEFDGLMKRWGLDTYCHPPTDGVKRAWTKNHKKIYKAKPYLERNAIIVQKTQYLLATPKTMREELRSGTWSTIRVARRLGRNITIIWPDGTVTNE